MWEIWNSSRYLLYNPTVNTFTLFSIQYHVKIYIVIKGWDLNARSIEIWNVTGLVNKECKKIFGLTDAKIYNIHVYMVSVSYRFKAF